MVNYNDGKIYKIIDNTNGNIYIGSTAEKLLCKRLSKHKTSYKCYLNPNIKQGYMRSFDILKNNDYRIILIEECNCEKKEQLLSREQYWIDKLDCINYLNPIGDRKKSKQIWADNNKDKIKITHEKYRENNREIMNERNRLNRYSISINNINKIDPNLFSF